MRKSELRWEIIEFAREKNIKHYCDLVNYCIDNKKMNWFQFDSDEKNQIFFSTYFNEGEIDKKQTHLTAHN